jgi:hypothetical protein
MHGQIVKGRRRERGVTIVITAIALVAMLAMAALAIDVVTLYLASGEAQKTADAAALAGAKVFVSSGFTSGQLGDPTGVAAQDQVCNGTTGLSDYSAQAAARQNLIAGTAPTTVTTSCSFTTPENPRITVAVTRTGLPTFFARIWAAGASRVSGTATAEAYNPSGSTVPVSVAVKPFLIPNCAPTDKPPCPGGYYVKTSNYTLPYPAAYIGTSYNFRPVSVSPQPQQYYIVELPQATICPGTSGSCVDAGSGGLYDNIACANANELSCGATVTVDIHAADGSLVQDTIGGTQCLIHAAPLAPSTTVACASPNTLQQDCFLPGLPVTINGGTSNPNPALRAPAPTSVTISRSDSVVTVPLYDGLTDPCAGGGPPCSGSPAVRSVQIIGFLQLGIQDVRIDGSIDAVVLNAAGCDPNSSGNPVRGGGVSPIPVRLTQ